MIRVVQRDLTANERRRLRSSSSMEEPILSVAPDSRRACDLRRQQLDAMGIAVNELRGRVDHTEHARWWRAWTSAPDVRSLTVLAPHVADPDALGLLLLDADQRLEAVTVVAPTRLPSRHKLLLERLAEDWTTPSGWTEASPTVAVQTREPAPDLPPVPRVNTLSLLAVSAEAHSTADHQRLADRLREHTTTFDAAADQGPEAVLAQLQRAGAGAASDDELLLVLHGLAAAGWRRGGLIQLDPHLVARRSGAALRGLGDETLARLARQAFPARGVVLVLGALGWSPTDVLDVTVEQLDASGALRVPGPAQVALRALVRLRRADGASAGDRAIPAAAGRHAVRGYTVRRWIGSLGPVHGVHTPNARSRRGATSAEERLHRLGIRMRDA